MAGLARPWQVLCKTLAQLFVRHWRACIAQNLKPGWQEPAGRHGNVAQQQVNEGHAKLVPRVGGTFAICYMGFKMAHTCASKYCPTYPFEYNANRAGYVFFLAAGKHTRPFQLNG